MTNVLQMIDSVFSCRVCGFYNVILAMLSVGALIIGVLVVRKGIVILLSLLGTDILIKLIDAHEDSTKAGRRQLKRNKVRADRMIVDSYRRR